MLAEEESGNIHREAVSLLQRLRSELYVETDLGSVDNIIRNAAASHRRQARRQAAFINGGGLHVRPEPPAGYLFVPMSTAPTFSIHPPPLDVATAPAASAASTPARPPTGASPPSTTATTRSGSNTARRSTSKTRAKSPTPTSKSSPPPPKKQHCDPHQHQKPLAQPRALRREVPTTSTPHSTQTIRDSPPPLRTSAMRRSASSRQLDYERERMARDHLRRMNIICRNRSYDVVISGQRQEDGVFADPLYNGTALCQLIHALIDGSSAVDAIPCRDPHNLAEVSRNYVAALSALSDSVEVFGLSKSVFCITPEDVYVGGNPTALLELLVHLLGHCPPVEELGTHNPTWTWQPAADAPFQRDFDATRWARAERFSVQFLRRLGALPDPRRQPLPPTTQVVPGPLEAPYLRTPNQLQDCDDEDDVVDHVDARRSAEEPISLHTPSIFPFLLNGVVLGRAAQALMDEGLGTNIKAVGRNGGLRRPLIVTTNPRTLSACRANVVAALEVFNACTGIPARPFDALVADVVSGHRQSIVNMLLNLANKFMSDAEAAKEVGASAPPPPPQAASTLRQPGMMRRATTPSTMDERTNPRPAIRVTAVRPPPQPLTARQPVEMDEEMMLEEEGRFTAKEVRQLGSWLRSVLGDDFLYAAEDDSFSISMTHFSFVAPCMVFSDGVVLAHMIRALECRRCDALECVKPTSKTAAKRFNVRRCIDFLRTERRARFLLPGIEECLVGGDVRGVLCTIKALRSTYKFV